MCNMSNAIVGLRKVTFWKVIAITRPTFLSGTSNMMSLELK